MFVLTLLLKGGLNQMTFLLQFSSGLRRVLNRVSLSTAYCTFYVLKADTVQTFPSWVNWSCVVEGLVACLLRLFLISLSVLW